MSRGSPARNRLHGRLQRGYRAWRLRRFLSAYVRPGDTAFDVGANEGEWTAALRRLGARVIAVEPQSACADAIRSRFGDDPEVEVVQSAAGETPGTGILHPAVTGASHASMSDEWRRASSRWGIPADGWLDPVEVPVTTLDALIEDFGLPVLCKIDVEGFEPDVLAGLSRSLPAITFEFHYDMVGKVERCVEILRRLGEYRYRLFVDEWPDPTGGEVPADDVAEAVAALPAGTWGMIVARRI
jgi:FkbM family methyltransferase